MLLAGVLLRNIPVVTNAVYIDFRWSAALRNIALAVILARAGLGLDGSVGFTLLLLHDVSQARFLECVLELFRSVHKTSELPSRLLPT